MISGIDPSKRQEQQQGTSKKKCLFLEKMSVALIKHILSFIEAPTDRGNAATCKAFRVIVTELRVQGEKRYKEITKTFENVLKSTLCTGNPEVSRILKQTMRHLAHNIIPNQTINSPVTFHSPIAGKCLEFVTGKREYWILLSKTLDTNQGFSFPNILDKDANYLSGFSTKRNYHTYHSVHHIAKMSNGQHFLPILFCICDKETLLVIQSGFSFTFTDVIHMYRKTPLPLTNKLKMAASILKAISFLHDWGIVHGNLDLDSIVFSVKNVAYVTNFTDTHIKENGKLAKLIKDSYPSKHIFKAYKTIVNKPIDAVKAYFAAKTDIEREDALKMFDDFPNDIWHLGILFTNIFFNGAPFTGSSLQEMIAWGDSETFPYPPYQEHGHSAAFMDPVIIPMLAQDSKKRPTITQVVDHFLDVIHKKFGKKFYTLEHFLSEF